MLYTLKGLTPGTVIKAYVVPMNDGGAGPASPVVEKTVPAQGPRAGRGARGIRFLPGD
jgi:hypothetical protein